MGGGVKRDKVTIQTPSTSSDSEAIVSQSWTTVAEIEGVVLPYGNERALREFGFSEDVKYRFFFKGQHPELKVGNRILYKGLELPIVYVANYGKALDVLLNTSGNTGFASL